ncbi:MAG TPA: hypothetical protein VGB55_15435 [Tepidisphaeraceae bacterium]|jgi:hypothetical protein
MVRPWALLGPVIVLLIAAPLLRPLRDPGLGSAREVAAIETVRALLTRNTYDLPPAMATNEAVMQINGRLLAEDSPAFLTLLAAIARLIEAAGVTFSSNALLLEYLLILFAAAVPTAFACGLLYRMSRIFELPRPWRVGLAVACVLATGWISYAVVLLPTAAATAGVVAALACLIHASGLKSPVRVAIWLAFAGLCGAGAVALEPAAMGVLLLSPLVVMGMTHSLRLRFLGLILLAAGAAIPLLTAASINRSLTGDAFPPSWHDASFEALIVPALPPISGDDLEPLTPSAWAAVGRGMNRLIVFTVGSHGVLSHFPVLLLGLAGASAVLHRHWPRPVKWLAGGCVGVLLALLISGMAVPIRAADLDFAAPKLIIVSPPLLIWAGAWLRKRHGPIVWIIAALAVAISTLISLLGAIVPTPPGGYTGYTAAEATDRWLHPEEPAIARRR